MRADTSDQSADVERKCDPCNQVEQVAAPQDLSEDASEAVERGPRKVYYDANIFVHARNPQNKRHASSLTILSTDINWKACVSPLTQLEATKCGVGEYYERTLAQWLFYDMAEELSHDEFASARGRIQGLPGSLRGVGLTNEKDIKHLQWAWAGLCDHFVTNDEQEFHMPKVKKMVKRLADLNIVVSCEIAS